MHQYILAAALLMLTCGCGIVYCATGVLQNSQPVAACIVEFAGGAGSWVVCNHTSSDT